MQSPTIVFLVIALILVLALFFIRDKRGMSIALVSDSAGNEAILTKATMRHEKMLFLIDTAYAGAPVLSTSYLSYIESRRGMRTKYSHDLQTKYRLVVDASTTNDDSPDARMTQSSTNALASFIARTGCRMYTSGGTMRLMGIGETTESQSDLLLCPDVRFGIHGGLLNTSASEVFVTNPLPSSVHILTMDFMMHRSPCVLMPARGQFIWNVDDARMHSSFVFLHPTFVGGAIRIPMLIGGTELNIVIDTGASAPLSIARDTHITTCRPMSTPLRATQVGVNGEQVCSDALFTNVQIGSLNMGEIQVFFNSHPIQGADGYAGMGLLRALDIWFASHEVGFRYSGLQTRTSAVLTEGKCENTTLPQCSVRNDANTTREQHF